MKKLGYTGLIVLAIAGQLEPVSAGTTASHRPKHGGYPGVLPLVSSNPFTPSTSSIDFDSGTVFTIKKVADLIEPQCSPIDCVVIGLGRSPGIFMAELQNRTQKEHPNYAWTLPLGSLQGAPAKLTKEQSDEYRQFFDRLQIKTKTAGKRIVLIDYVQEGTSLARAGQYLQDYLGSDQTVSLLGIEHSGVSLELHPQIENRIVIPSKNSVITGLKFKGLSGLAEFQHYAYTDLKQPIISNPRYGELRKFLDQYKPHPEQLPPWTVSNIHLSSAPRKVETIESKKSKIEFMCVSEEYLKQQALLPTELPDQVVAILAHLPEALRAYETWRAAKNIPLRDRSIRELGEKWDAIREDFRIPTEEDITHYRERVLVPHQRALPPGTQNPELDWILETYESLEFYKRAGWLREMSGLIPK